MNPSNRAGPAAAANRLACALTASLSLVPAWAHAETAATNLDAVQVSGRAEVPIGSVNRIDLSNSRPVSGMGHDAIEAIVAPAGDFGTIANLLPSFVSSAPNGNGFDAAKNMTLRGFPDGQFNVTIDGIPFADPDGFAHHSTSILPMSSIESVQIDRSPGSGTSLGYATMGGSLDISSLAIPDAAGTRAYGSYGSFSTIRAGARLNTARPKADGQTGFMINVQRLQTTGAMSHGDGRRNDILLKGESWIGPAKLAVMYTYDDYHFNNPASVTTTQIAQFGRTFGFSADPTQPSYYGYSTTDRHGDFGYGRLSLDLAAGFQATNTLYTYSYVNQGLSLKGDFSASPVPGGLGAPSTDIGGRLSNNRYRTVGDILQLERSDEHGTLKAGLWLEHSHQVNRRSSVDLSTGAFLNENKNAGTSSLYDYDSRLDTVQPFAEYDWRVASGLVLKPGLRYQRVRRAFDARVVPNSLPGTNGELSRTVDSLLPSIEGNYALSAQTHAFVQWAKGALVPNQSFFYSANPALGNQVQPEVSRALQGGVAYVSGTVGLSADVYWVEMSNYVSTVTLNGNTQFINNGKVRFRGVEVEGHAGLGAGFSGMFNASLMQAQFQTSGVTSTAQRSGDTIPLVPAYTGVAGLLYQSGPWHGSLFGKFIGAQYQGKNGSSDGENFRVDPYHYLSLIVGRSIGDFASVKGGRVDFRVDNLEDHSAVTDKAGPSALGPVQVNVLARRSYSLVFQCDL